MSKFSLFLQQANFKEKALKEAKLRNVVVDTVKKGWTFEIDFEETPSPEGFDQFLDSIKLYFTISGTIEIIDVKVKINDDSSWQQEAEKYYHWLLDKLILKRSSYSIYKNYKVEFTANKYLIHIDSELKKHQKTASIFKPFFAKYGIITEFEFIVDESIPTSGDILRQKKSKAMTEIPIYTKPVKRQAPKTVATRTYHQKIDNSKIQPIKDIPKTNHELDKYLNLQNDPNFTIEGVIIEVEVRKLRTTHLLIMTIADSDDAIVVKQFLNNAKAIEEASKYQMDYLVRAAGKVVYDTFMHDVILMANVIETVDKVSKKERKDTAKEKRIEFHLHTKMSNLDGIGDVKEYIDQAIKWGHKAIAFTDHDGLYAFPEIAKYSLGKDIKPIYGVELNYFDETKFKLAFNDSDIDLRRARYVVFDLETTGLSYTRDKIIEISAVKIENQMIVDEFNAFVNPEEKLSHFTTELTSITDADLKDAETIEQVLPRFLTFIEGSILVAHNAAFDIGHLYQKIADLNLGSKRYPTIDTINIARYFYSDEIKRFNLRAVARFFKVRLEQHHRAEYDAKATAEIFLKMLDDLLKLGIKLHSDINRLVDLEKAWKCGFTSHLNLLVATQEGYKNLAKLVSETLTDYFHDGPRLTKKTLEKYREGLLIGSGCYKGEVFEAALYKTDQELIEAMEIYDYIEVQPPQAYRHFHQDLGSDAEFIIESTIRKIVFTAAELGKLVIATGDVHYLNQEDAIYRDIYIRAKLVGGGLHDLASYEQTPLVYFLTTDEMLKQFSFLGESLAFEIVVGNTNILNNKIEAIEAFPKTLYSLRDDTFKDNLKIDSLKEEVDKIVYQNAHRLYGENLHPIVEKRINDELGKIIDNEYAPIYYISYLLTKKSLEDGYLVGSRGSVGSSLVALLMEITEVNPLKPHYRCKNRCFTAFELSEEEIKEHNPSDEELAFQPVFKGIFSGYDLPDKDCPFCSEKLIKDGQDIPFETFLGYVGDKIPDIDLNFSGDYQATAHSYVRTLLGEKNAYRAGTIQTVAERNAFGYVMGYLEDKNITDVRKAQISRLAKKIEGVKRSTGQHPGGIVVVPSHKEIFDVTPIQYPADDTTAEWKTTHFDYHSFEDNLLKLDILGHDDPTVIKFLMDYVKKYPERFPFTEAQDIPVDDKAVYQLFSGTSSIGLTEEQLESNVASFGVPEFGTPFVRRMLNDTRPSSFAGLVKISGLSHGTDVWLSNAQALIKDETEFKNISFDDIIGCRDDIMVDLMEYGMAPAKAFEIMEFVRRGNPSKDKRKWEEYTSEMSRNKVPNWYIWSCSQIKYMFPKAHACAYVLMAVRIAWFKVYHPEIFYSSFFSIRATQFEHETMVSGINAIRNRIKEIERIPLFQQSDKEQNLLITLQVAFEMYLRDIKFLPVDINKSAATEFIIEETGLRMPFITLDGLGKSVADDIVVNREAKEFRSKEDVRERTKINKTVFEIMEKIGSFDDLEEQTDIFEQGLFAL
ncbi:MAG: PolC-type DNA polymerase III [Acholeplasmataceae bacterium]|jgi:DNA polymerase-3 subunit alpha (Gram-positive type)|nr:PolC-type DNA polymerase III [Acholeplasmataceae bacterium]